MKNNYYLITLFLLSFMSSNILAQSQSIDIFQSKMERYNLETEEFSLTKQNHNQKDFEMFQIDSIISFYPDELMTNPTKELRSFNENDQIATSIIYEQIDDVWVFLKRTSYQYYEDGQGKEMLEEIWEDNEWTFSKRDTYIL